MKNGGYAIISHDDVNIFNKVDNAYNSGKPILFYDDDKTCFFIDTTKKVGDDYVLVKGGKTITITDANTVSSTGLVDAPTMENIKDLNGNLRFIEGNIEVNEVTGLSFTYAKWSLSGTHLMIVLVGTMATGSYDFSLLVSDIAVPSYVRDKIVKLFSSDVVDRKTITAYAEDATTQTFVTSLYKRNTDAIQISMSATSSTADRSFRIQFDLLIDAE